LIKILKEGHAFPQILFLNFTYEEKRFCSQALITVNILFYMGLDPTERVRWTRQLFIAKLVTVEIPLQPFAFLGGQNKSERL